MKYVWHAVNEYNPPMSLAVLKSGAQRQESLL